VEGDLPEKNIFRLKPTVSSEKAGNIVNNENFTVTIVTQTFIAVYKLSFVQQEKENDTSASTAFVLLIDPTKAIQLNNFGKVTDGDFERLAIRAMSNKRRIYKVEGCQSGMGFWLNNVYVIGDLMLFDMGAQNHTNLQYDLNGLNFKLADRYAVNATVSQEIEIKPLYSYTDDANTVIERKWRNFYILKKFTFPAQKVLKIQMTENQVSGRPITISIGYDKILSSRSLIGEKD
jgi:conjugative transposon TraN protein